MSMGMLMLPPIMISLPFKLLLFVLVDGCISWCNRCCRASWGAMTEQMAVEICKDAVWTTLLVASPMLIAGLVVASWSHCFNP